MRLRNIVIWGNSTGGRVAQVFAGLHPELVTAVISEDVGPERPREIADGFTSRVKREDETGWASEEELFANLKAGNSRTPDEILRAYAHYGSKPRVDGRIVWKRDPSFPPNCGGSSWKSWLKSFMYWAAEARSFRLKLRKT